VTRKYLQINEALNQELLKFRFAIVSCSFYSLIGLLFSIEFGNLIVIALTILYFLVLIQSTRGSRKTKMLKAKLQSDSSSVKYSDVIAGPVLIGIPGLNWFVSITR